jgi:hypothetical protein
MLKNVDHLEILMNFYFFWGRNKDMKRLLSIVIVPLVMLLFYNQVANWHFHMLPNGIVIEHAHPFAKAKTADSPYQNHTHTDMEYMILGLISSTIGLVVVLFILSILVIPTISTKLSNFSDNFIPIGYFPFNNPHRGPPSYFQ